ncbi:MAG TPA: hypothetical protein VGZ01_03880 [Trinickia sp.]|jgi:hypothetical protein|nr:hypothetical protein [Trinickia sp.]
MRCNASIAAVLCCASLAARAQTEAPPAAVDWQLQVLRNGQTIDTFESTTTIGQAYTATHHHETVHRIGCKEMPAAKIDLVRSLTVSPVAVDARGITLSIESNDTVEDDSSQRTIEGCALPPQPRRVAASHPGLIVPGDAWTNWTIVERNPTLVYRVRASVTSH